MSTVQPGRRGVFGKILFVLKVIEIRMRFVAILVITALVVGHWDTIQNYYERWERQRTAAASKGPQPDQQTTAENTYEYYCGMHPFVIRDQPGKCPICGMDLIKRMKRATAALPEGTLARVQVSPERIMQAGINVEPVEYRLLTQSVRSYGVIEMDDTRVARISLRFPGRVEELMVNAVGQEVKKGDPLARIYSAKFLGATQEYLEALSSLKKEQQAKPDATGLGLDTVRFAQGMVDSTRKRLALAGYTVEQLDEIQQSGKAKDNVIFYSPLAGTVVEKNVLLGDTLDEGAMLYTVADLSTLWVQAQIIESDMSMVKLGTPVEVTSVPWPGEIFYGNVDLVYPVLNANSRTVKARVVVINKNSKLRPGMAVMTVISSPVGHYGEIGTPDEPKMDSIPPSDHQEHTSAAVVSSNEGSHAGHDMHAEHAEQSHPADLHAGHGGDDTSHVDAGNKAGEPLMGRWAEGYTCPMHPDMLLKEPGDCKVCGCDMKLRRWRVEGVLSIPETAVVDTGTQQIVYVESSPGVYDARAVTLGHRAGKYYPVLSGLNRGDRIVARGSFLIDAESRLNPSGPAPSGGHHHGQ